jgi:hypothetical protein
MYHAKLAKQPAQAVAQDQSPPRKDSMGSGNHCEQHAYEPPAAAPDELLDLADELDAGNEWHDEGSGDRGTYPPTDKERRAAAAIRALQSERDTFESDLAAARAAGRELLRQIDAFVAVNGEADFYTGDARRVLGDDAGDGK